MKTRLTIFAAIMAAVVLMASSATATHYGVFGDGGYSPGSARSRMDEVVTGRVNEAKRIFEQRNPPPGGQTTSVNTENGLKQALEDIEAKCGDTITVVLMGHGTSSGFRFTKEKKTVTHKELREWLGQAATECCAKINVVIMACHSGGFVEELFKDPHMQSVYTSSQPCKRTYSYQYWENGEMIDNGDWMRFFNEDWDAATGATIADQLEEASRTAREKMPPGSPAEQIPTGWRRGKQQARAHVRTVRKSGGEITRMLVHFYDPEFLRCQERWVEPDAGVSVPNDLQKCNWINFEADLDNPSDGKSETRNRIKISGDVTTAFPPGVSEGVDIVAHVKGVDRSANKIRIHTVKPHWMYCTTRYLKVTGTGTIASDIAFCKWIEQNVVITDPQGDIETPSSVEVTDQTFRIEAHVKGSFNHESGTFDVHILKPRFMRCSTVRVQLPPGERHKMSGTNRIHNCDNIILDLNTGTTTEGFYPGSDMHKVQNLAHQQYFHPFVQPQATVGNVGEEPLVDLNVVCTITNLQSGELVYDDAQPFVFDAAEPFESGATLDVIFTEWTPPAVGSYQVDFEVLAEDMNPVNNRLSRTVQVMPPEVHPFPGDADLNGFIDLSDLIFVRNNLGGDVNTGDTWQADINGDDTVDLLDLITVRNRQGENVYTTPPFSRQFIWHADGELELPPDPDNPDPQTVPLHMFGTVTLNFEEGTEPGSYNIRGDNRHRNRSYRIRHPRRLLLRRNALGQPRRVFLANANSAESP